MLSAPAAEFQMQTANADAFLPTFSVNAIVCHPIYEIRIAGRWIESRTRETGFCKELLFLGGDIGDTGDSWVINGFAPIS